MSSRAGRADTAAWRRAKAQAVRDAQGTCQLCGQELDPGAPRNTPWGTEVDHLTALSQGGDPFARDNLRAVHRWCHQRRDKGLPPAPVPAATYDWQNGCPDTHKGQDCYTTGPTFPHSRRW